MPDKHYVNEVGTEITLDTGILIGSAADQYIYYIKPGGVTGSWDASLYSSHSNIANAIGTYYVQYTLDSGDLDTIGKWKLQAYVASVAGTWHGETVDLQVFDLGE